MFDLSFRYWLITSLLSQKVYIALRAITAGVVR